MNCFLARVTHSNVMYTIESSLT